MVVAGHLVISTNYPSRPLPKSANALPVSALKSLYLSGLASFISLFDVCQAACLYALVDEEDGVVFLIYFP